MEANHLIQTGLKGQQAFTVDETHSAAHIGSGTVSVLSTPSMIAFMEITARGLLDDYLPDTHTTVGVHVDVHHLAACPVGAEVMARVAVLSVEDRRVTLSLEVWQGEKQLGHGLHERVIVDKARFLERSFS
jgi:predicted thioesterase